MRKTVFATLLLAALMAAPIPALAWDYPGHRIVGAIADLVLHQHYPKTYKRVSDLLEIKDASGNVRKRTLSEVAVFPDCAKDEVEFCGRKPTQEERDYVGRAHNKDHHKGFHFTNSPFQVTAYQPDGVGANATDVVTMITYTAAQLRGATPAVPSKTEVELTNTEALWLLTHLVGDIHQPLHTGQAYYAQDCKSFVNPNDDKSKEAISTLGGNTLKFAAVPPVVPLIPNLHLYWDSTAVLRAMHADGYFGAEQAFAKMLAASPPPARELVVDPESAAKKWFAEMILLAQDAYTRPGITVDGRVDAAGHCQWTIMLDDSYERWAQDVAREQVRKAGFRLAALLVAIFPNN